MGRGFRLNDDLPLTPLELARDKRLRARESARLDRADKFERRELLTWLINQRIELVGRQHGFVTITFRRVLKRRVVVVHQDLKSRPEEVPISEFGPHGRRSGAYLPSTHS
jgi:hypothetical protein